MQIHPGFPGPADHAVRWGLYVNYEWSGTKPPDDDSAWTTFATYIGLAVGAYDWTPFVQIIRSAPRWPAYIGVGEAVQWRWKGYEGAYGACTALRAAGGPPYVPLVGTLPGGPQRGPFGPGLLIDPTQLEIHHWLGDPDLPGYSEERHHNLAVLSLPGAPRDQWFALIVTHGSHIDARDQLRHAKALARFGRLPLRVVILADWNATPSGPRFDVGEFDNPRFHRPPWVIHKVNWEPGPGQAGPYTAATGALDTLVGHWAERGDDGGRRVAGSGFFHLAEVAGVFTPTQYAHPSGRPPRAIDGAVVNEAMLACYVPGSYLVLEPADPSKPGTDHKAITFALNLAEETDSS